MGRAFRILHRTSHITVAVSEDETLRKVAAKPKGRRTVRRKAEPEAAAALPKAKRSAAKPKAETVAAPVENANPESVPEEKTD